VNLSLNPQIREANKSIFKKYGAYFLLFFMVLIMGKITVVTLVYSTKQVTKGYAINMLDKEHQILVRKIDALNLKINEKKALTSIQTSEKFAMMRSPSNIAYLRADNSIASR
jgi:hypothetical protein